MTCRSLQQSNDSQAGAERGQCVKGEKRLTKIDTMRYYVAQKLDAEIVCKVYSLVSLSLEMPVELQAPGFVFS